MSGLLQPPPRDRPGDVLRWVRRVSLATSALLVVGAALVWLDGDRTLAALVIGGVGIAVVNAATMGPAIRRADERGRPKDPDETDHPGDTGPSPPPQQTPE